MEAMAGIPGHEAEVLRQLVRVLIPTGRASPHLRLPPNALSSPGRMTFGAWASSKGQVCHQLSGAFLGEACGSDGHRLYARRLEREVGWAFLGALRSECANAGRRRLEPSARTGVERYAEGR